MPLVLFAGAVATIFTCFLITPFEAVRIRMVERPGRVRVRVGVRVGVRVRVRVRIRVRVRVSRMVLALTPTPSLSQTSRRASPPLSAVTWRRAASCRCTTGCRHSW